MRRGGSANAGAATSNIKHVAAIFLIGIPILHSTAANPLEPGPRRARRMLAGSYARASCRADGLMNWLNRQDLKLNAALTALLVVLFALSLTVGPASLSFERVL